MDTQPAVTLTYQAAGNIGWALEFSKMALSAIVGGLVAYGVNFAATRKAEKYANIRETLYLQTYLLYVFNSLDSIKSTYISKYQKMNRGAEEMPSRGSVSESFRLDLSKYVFMFSLKENRGLDSDVAILMKKLPEHLSNASQYFDLIKTRDSIKAIYNQKRAAASDKYPSGVPDWALQPSLDELQSITVILFGQIDGLISDSLELLYRAKRIAAKYDSRAVLQFETPGYEVKFSS